LVWRIYCLTEMWKRVYKTTWHITDKIRVATTTITKYSPNQQPTCWRPTYDDDEEEEENEEEEKIHTQFVVFTVSLRCEKWLCYWDDTKQLDIDKITAATVNNNNNNNNNNKCWSLQSKWRLHKDDDNEISDDHKNYTWLTYLLSHWVVKRNCLTWHKTWHASVVLCLKPCFIVAW